MKKKLFKIYTSAIVALFATALFTTAVSAEKPTPGFNTPIPEYIMTPD